MYICCVLDGNIHILGDGTYCFGRKFFKYLFHTMGATGAAYLILFVRTLMKNRTQFPTTSYLSHCLRFQYSYQHRVTRRP